MLDTHRDVITPEGVALHLPAAGPVPRAAAWLIDFGLRMVLLMCASMVLALLGRTGMGLYAVVTFVVFWFYPVLFEAMWDGRTPGKRALGLQVISANGAPVGWLAAFLRNLMRVVDMLPIGYAFGLMASLGDPYGRRLGDMIAGTQVVHVVRAPEPFALSEQTPMPPPVPLQAYEQSALIAFFERAPQLTQARQVELADLAEPLVHARGPLAVARLYGIAHWLLGRRA